MFQVLHFKKTILAHKQIMINFLISYNNIVEVTHLGSFLTLKCQIINKLVYGEL